MVEPNHARRIEPNGIHPHAIEDEKKIAQLLGIQPRKIGTVAHIATVANPIIMAVKYREEKWL